jgi:tetratricopeptide (TPR) repeat protein
MDPATAIRELTPAFIEAMKAGRKADAANIEMLIGHAFGLDANYTSFLECAKMARRLDPGNPTVVAFNMQALLRLSRLRETGELVRQYEAAANKNSYLARMFYDYYRAMGEADKANDYLKLALKLNPHDPVIYSFLARHGANTPEETAHYFELAAQNAEPGSYRQQASLFNVDKARLQDKVTTKWLDASAKDYPDEPNWMANKALWLAAKGRNDEAFALYERAANSPKRISMRAWMQFATFCAFNKRPETAKAVAQHCMQLSPELPDTYLTAGHVWRTLGQDKQAERYFSNALTCNPQFNSAYEALRDMPAYQSGAARKSLDEKWLANCPQKADAWLFSAESLRADKKWQQALDAYNHAEERFAKQRPRESEKNTLTWCRIYSGKGTCAYKLGDIASATAAARTFNAKRPPMTDAMIRVRPRSIDFTAFSKDTHQAESAEHAALADMLYECGELDDCVTEYKRAIALWNNPEWHRGLLKAYMDKQDYASAANEDVVVANETVTKDLPGMLDKAKKMFGL